MWPGMTRKEFERTKRYLRELADPMGLRDWSFHLGRIPLEESSGNLATVQPTYGQRDAVIRLCIDFPTKSSDERRYILVHELLHCHLDRIMTPFRENRVVWRLLGSAAADVIDDQVRENIEHAVDAIAREWAPALPLPGGAS